MNLIKGLWKIAPPEKTKTRAGKDSARCWKVGGVSLILEKGLDETFYDTGFVIHYHKAINGAYCG